jgi:hypothetical protein
MPASEPLPWDWRDGTYYAPLLQLERPGFAWEWLRRDERYRGEAHLAGFSRRILSGIEVRKDDDRASNWGLHAFEDPDLPAPLARPVWRSEVHPSVLPAEAGPAGPRGDSFSLGSVRSLATLVEDRNRAEHLLLSDGARSVRVDSVGLSVAAGAVTFRYRLEGLESAERPVLALRRLLALARTGRFSAALHPPDVRARRWVALLRTVDALAAGAGQREIAEHLVGREAAEPGWRVEAPALRSQAQRLVRQARTIAAGRYLELLQ